MKRLMVIMMVFLSTEATALACNKEISSFFKDTKTEGCFLLYNLTANKYEVSYGGKNCEKQVSPASTFKIPNSLIGLDLEISKDENTVYKWDNIKRTITEHNQDHTLASAMKYSVVWYFQILAEKIGESNYKKYLKSLNYGNQDISGGLTKFWLGNSLKISPKEQVTFLKKLYQNQLNVSEHSSEVVKKILVLESSKNGTLSGKTGSTSVDGVNIGWFVGHILSGKTEYLFVTNMTQKGTDYKINNEYSGLASKAMTKEILSCQNLM